MIPCKSMRKQVLTMNLEGKQGTERVSVPQLLGKTLLPRTTFTTT